MSLSNAQYDEIMRHYEETRFKNRHILEEHRNEVYDLIPEYKEIETRISTLSVEQARKLIGGDEHALADLRTQLKELSARKTWLLENVGFPPNYLDPIYTCQDCKDTGYIDNQKCHCLKQAIHRVLYAQSNVESVLESENFDNLTYEYYNDSEIEQMRNVVAQCKQFVNDFSRTYENLLFFGSIGVGKTFLTNCIAKALLDEGYSVIYFTSFQLFDTLSKYVFRSGTVSEEISSIHEDIFSCDLLIIDDLGTETTNSFVCTQLFTILNERNNRKKSTIISTNLTYDIIDEKYSERNFSRIFSFYKPITLHIDDIRIKMKQLKNRK